MKLVDHYLVEVVSMRDKLQLIGSTAILIASKFEVTPYVISWGAGVEGALRLWSRWVTGEGQVPAVPGHCPESCWGGVFVLMLPLPIPRAANAMPVGWILSPHVTGDLAPLRCAETTRTPEFTSCKQSLELEPVSGAVQTTHEPHWTFRGLAGRKPLQGLQTGRIFLSVARMSPVRVLSGCALAGAVPTMRG